MNSILKNCYTVPEMAECLDIAPTSLRSHKMGEIKACCKTYKWARKIYVNKADFDRYATKAINKTR